jgi:hypothetical protein
VKTLSASAGNWIEYKRPSRIWFDTEVRRALESHGGSQFWKMHSPSHCVSRDLRTFPIVCRNR